MTTLNSEDEFEELDADAMVHGIGRKATDEELIDYLSKDGGEPISLEEAFSKYKINTSDH